MTTLADLQVGDAFVSVGLVESSDPSLGDTLTLYGPSDSVAGTLTIGTDGTFSGSLAAPPGEVLVQLVPQLSAAGTATMS